MNLLILKLFFTGESLKVTSPCCGITNTYRASDIANAISGKESYIRKCGCQGCEADFDCKILNAYVEAFFAGTDCYYNCPSCQEGVVTKAEYLFNHFQNGKYEYTTGTKHLGCGWEFNVCFKTLYNYAKCEVDICSGYVRYENNGDRSADAKCLKCDCIYSMDTRTPELVSGQKVCPRCILKMDSYDKGWKCDECGADFNVMNNLVSVICGMCNDTYVTVTWEEFKKNPINIWCSDCTINR